MGWYDEIYVKITNDKNTINELVEWLKKNYKFELEELTINKKEKSFSLNGGEHLPFYKDNPRQLPEVVDIFRELTCEFPLCEYSGNVIYKDNRSDENIEWFIKCENGFLKMEMPPLGYSIDMYYEDYEEFCEDWDEDTLTEEEYEKYKDEDVIYIYTNEQYQKDDNGGYRIIDEREIYTEEEYYNTRSEVFCEKISNLIALSKVENIDEQKLLDQIEEEADYIEKVPDNLKNDRDFVLKAVRRNGFAITYINNELASDRELVIEAIKNDPYVIDFLKGELSDDEELIALSDSIIATFEDEEE